MWTHFPDVHDVRPVDGSDRAVLFAIREVLTKHNALKRFGVSLIHRHFDLQDGEILFESTDTEKRQQFMEVKSAAFLDRADVLQTQWVFNESHENVICVAGCAYYD